MKKTLLQEVKAMNKIAGTELTKEQEIAIIRERLEQLSENKKPQSINESIIAAIIGTLAIGMLGAEILSGDAHGGGIISSAIADIKRKWKGEPTSKEIWTKVVRDDEIRKFVKNNASDIVKKGKNYKSKELEDLVKNHLDTKNK